MPDHPYRMLINEGSGSGKTNSLFNLINYHSDIDNFFLKRGSTGLKHLSDSKRCY